MVDTKYREVKNGTGNGEAKEHMYNPWTWTKGEGNKEEGKNGTTNSKIIKYIWKSFINWM